MYEENLCQSRKVFFSPQPPNSKLNKILSKEYFLKMKTYIYVIKIKTCHNMECLKLVKIKYILKSKFKGTESYIARLKKKINFEVQCT